MALSKKTLGWSVALAAVGVALFGWNRYRAATPQSPVKLETSSVDRGRIVSRVTATGTLSALVTVQVGSQVSGRIQQLLADFNSEVKKGQLIARIDPQLFQAALEQSRANYAAAKGEVARARVQAVEAERQWARVKGLTERGLVAEAERDTAQANAEAAKAQVMALEGRLEQARAALHQAEVNLAYTSIASPIDGVVISRSVDVGQTVAASLQAPTLFVIAEDLAKMQVNTSVAEADVGKLQAGMGATFTVDAYPTERFRGTVRQVRNAPQTVQNVVTYDAVVDVANPELKLKPGMTANVTFVHAERDDVLRIPNGALRFRPPAELLGAADAGTPGAVSARGAGGRQGGGNSGARTREVSDWRTLWVLRDGSPTPVPVRIRIGITDGTLTEVVEGELREGDQVVIDASGGKEGNARPGSGSGPGGPGGFRRIF